MHELYELKEKLMEELERYGQEELTAGSLEVVDKLSHAIKNLHKIIEKCEEEEYSMEGGQSSYAQGGQSSYARRGQSSYAYEGEGGQQSAYARANRGGQSSYGQSSYGQSSYARGRGRNAKRDSRGRYASEAGYAGNEEMIAELYGLMEDAPDEKTRKEFEKFIKKVEMM